MNDIVKQLLDPQADASVRQAAADEICRLRNRLEMTAMYDLQGNAIPWKPGDPDGIECRDATIALLDAIVNEQRAKIYSIKNEFETLFEALHDTTCNPTDNIGVMIESERKLRELLYGTTTNTGGKENLEDPQDSGDTKPT